MRRTLMREPFGRGLVVLGGSVQGWYGPAPQPSDMAYLLRLEYRAGRARRLAVPPAQRVEANARATGYRARRQLQRDEPPVPWAEADWVVVLAEPYAPALQAALARFTARARRVEPAVAQRGVAHV